MAEEEAELMHEGISSDIKLYITHIRIVIYSLQSAFVCIISFAIHPVECLGRQVKLK